MHERQLHEKSDVHSHLNNALEKIICLETKVSTIETKVSTIETKVSTIETKVSMIETFSKRENEILQDKCEIQMKASAEKIFLLQRRVENLEKTTMVETSSIEERLSNLEKKTENFCFQRKLITEDAKCIDEKSQYGYVIWKIENFTHQLNQARKRNGTIYSQPFFSSQFGYKLRLFSDLNGHGTGLGTHLSLYFQIMSGPYDDKLKWPFLYKYTLSILHQTEYTKHKLHEIETCTKPERIITKNFSKPTSEVNAGFGNGDFCSHEFIVKGGYVHEDTIVIKCHVHLDS